MSPILSLHDISLSYGHFKALNGISLDAMPGERLVIIGPNGSGKSSLFDVISGFAKREAGEIWLNGQRIDRLSCQKRCRAGLVRSFQTSRLFAQMTVLEHVQCAAFFPKTRPWQRYAFWCGMHRMANVHDAAQAALQHVGLERYAQEQAGSLSYANQRLLELAIVLATDAKVLLLDEPTAGLSRAETQDFLGRIDTLAKDRTILMIEHDMSVVFQLAHRVVVLAQGQVLACDTPQAIQRNQQVQQLYLSGKNTETLLPGEPLC